MLFRLTHEASVGADVHADFGTALLELGYSKFAEDEFEQELAGNPECPQAQLGLAEIQVLRGDWDNANRYIAVLAEKHPHQLAALLDYPPAGTLRQAWTEHKLQLPETLSNSDIGQLWRAWLGGSGSAARWIEPGAETCTNLRSIALLKPGVWLTESCYLTQVRGLKAKQTFATAERAKWAEAAFRLGDYSEALHEASTIRATDPQNEWGVYWVSKAHAAISEDCFPSKTPRLSH